MPTDDTLESTSFEKQIQIVGRSMRIARTSKEDTRMISWVAAYS